MNNMRGRESKGPLSTDLLVCFPARAHLTLMPKPICSPARPSDSSKRHHQNHNHNQHQHQTNHHLRKLSSRGGGGGHASPLLWSKTKPVGPDISEPTSPKVTCAGQIKVRPKASCKNWQSVMEEIEKLHNDRKQKKKSSSWAEALGFKKDTMQFLTCLRRIRFDFRCFGSFPTSELTSDEEEEEGDDEVEEYSKKESGEVGKIDEDENSSTVFSKWFMVLQQEKNIPFAAKEQSEQRKQSEEYSDKEEPTVAPCGPPPNALLLMRCRSAPAKSWLEEREDEERENQQEEKKEKLEVKKEAKRSRSLAVVMRCDTDFYNFSSPDNIAKETWVVGGLRDAISRSRSWKR